MGKTLGEYLKIASALLDGGEAVKAGQVWQAILKKYPTHPEAMAGMERVMASLKAAAPAKTGAQAARAWTEPDDRGAAREAATLTHAPSMPPGEPPLKPMDTDTLLDAGHAPAEPGPYPWEAAPEPASLTPVLSILPEEPPLKPMDTAALLDAGPALAEPGPYPWEAAPEPASLTPVMSILPEEPPLEPIDTDILLDGGGIEALVQSGCALYDLGDLRGALSEWRRALALDPAHGNALSYMRGVCRELGIAMPDTPTPPETEQQTQGPDREPTADLVRVGTEEISGHISAGSNAYDMGDYESAIEEWAKALTLDPDNTLARGYLELAHRELKKSTDMPSPPTRRAEEDAPAPPPAFAARTATAEKSGPIPLQNPDGGRVQQTPPRWLPPAASGSPQPNGTTAAGHGRAAERTPITQMPASIIQGGSWERRGPVSLKKIQMYLYVQSLLRPLPLAVACAVCALLCVGLLMARSARKEALLRATAKSIREGAIAAANTLGKQPVRLLPSAKELCAQAKAAIDADPLRAFLLAQEAAVQDPMDPSAAELRERALATISAPGTPAQVAGRPEQFIAEGKLDSAKALLEAKLRHDPDDAATRQQLAHVGLLMARELAQQGRFDLARTHLLMGAALFPKDPAWQARLKLLEYLQSAPGAERPHWVDLLG